ncbi:hypothetical protein GCM10017044_06800 [Kordiimonas sediminis]|uniref:LPS-assembly lipoprotein n=1 Tax=Kordiimonas sediminis TaxID=1735581 RepID=A0A919ALZ7_9PROT|nr:LPS assembly lipoprotein LptE [Kordiimonas sediminis]GHF15299.1 hypothetical protein GCM10017044_06800 [Kordiimonas sediminis]
MLRVAALLVLLLLPSACGFKPLYKEGAGGAGIPAVLSTVEVAPIPDRLGQQMRFHLQDRLGHTGAPDYRVQVVLTQTLDTFGIKPDTSATQEQLIMRADFSLVRLSDGAEVLSDTYVTRTTYDIVISDFATVMQREDTARRLALDLADRIHRRIAFTLAPAAGKDNSQESQR